MIGVFVEQAASIQLPIDVKIDLGNVGGPSAGLAFALDVMEELGRDVDGGHKIAATGEIELDGRVVPVGGVKQKTIAVRRSGIDVFLVPAGDNAREARRHAGDLRIVPVKTFQQALQSLATLTAGLRQTSRKMRTFRDRATLESGPRGPIITALSGDLRQGSKRDTWLTAANHRALIATSIEPGSARSRSRRPVPTFRAVRRGAIVPPRQAPLIPRPAQPGKAAAAAA